MLPAETSEIYHWSTKRRTPGTELHNSISRLLRRNNVLCMIYIYNVCGYFYEGALFCRFPGDMGRAWPYLRVLMGPIKRSSSWGRRCVWFVFFGCCFLKIAPGGCIWRACLWESDYVEYLAALLDQEKKCRFCMISDASCFFVCFYNHLTFNLVAFDPWPQGKAVRMNTGKIRVLIIGSLLVKGGKEIKMTE